MVTCCHELLHHVVITSGCDVINYVTSKNVVIVCVLLHILLHCFTGHRMM